MELTDAILNGDFVKVLDVLIQIRIEFSSPSYVEVKLLTFARDSLDLIRKVINTILELFTKFINQFGSHLFANNER